MSAVPRERQRADERIAAGDTTCSADDKVDFFELGKNILANKCAFLQLDGPQATQMAWHVLSMSRITLHKEQLASWDSASTLVLFEAGFNCVMPLSGPHKIYDEDGKEMMIREEKRVPERSAYRGLSVGVSGSQSAPLTKSLWHGGRALQEDTE